MNCIKNWQKRQMIINDKVIEELRNAPPEHARLLLLANLELFVQVLHYRLWRKQFTIKPFHKKILNKFYDIVMGRNPKKNLYIGMPPRYGKSQLIVYILYIAYAYNMLSNNIYTSYSNGLCNKHSTQVRTLIEDEFLQGIFGLRLKTDTGAKDLWGVVGGGEFRAAPFGGALTGFAAGVMGDEFGGLAVVDDYMKPTDAWSQTMKDKVITWFEETFMSRLNNPTKTPIIIVGQRIGYDDLAGYVLEKYPDDWDVLIIPALDEETGEPTWPEKWPKETCEKVKRERPYVWAAQYQQKPIKRIEGALFDNPSMRGKLDDLQGGFCHIDAGYGGGDTTGITLFKKNGADGRITMLVKIYYDSVANHLQGIKLLLDQHNIKQVWCESNADKGFLAKEFIRMGVMARAYPETQNKFYKIATYLKKYWDIIDFCPESDPKAMEQILEFTETCEHDDVADSAATACRLIEKMYGAKADVL